MTITKIKTITVIILTLLLTISCEDNSGPTSPETATISGTVTFTGTWPDTGKVWLSLSYEWYPSTMPASILEITEGDLGSNNYDYTLTSVSFDTFPGLSVSWENPDTNYNASCNQSILGAYGGSSADYFYTVSSVITSITNHELIGYNIDANLNFAQPNPMTMCQPPCATLDNQDDCEEKNHCVWSNDQCTLIEQ